MKKEQHVTCKLPFVFECTHGTRKIQMIQHIIIFLKGWVREGWYSFDQEFFDYRHVGSNRLNHLIFVTEFILFYLCLCMAWSFPIFFFQLFIKRERGKKNKRYFCLDLAQRRTGEIGPHCYAPHKGDRHRQMRGAACIPTAREFMIRALCLYSTFLPQQEIIIIIYVSITNLLWL